METILQTTCNLIKNKRRFENKIIHGPTKLGPAHHLPQKAGTSAFYKNVGKKEKQTLAKFIKLTSKRGARN